MKKAAPNKKAAPPPARAPIQWRRADPDKLARFDPSSKICTMNCGPATGDPRSNAERKLLCDDCYPNMESATMIFTGDTIPTAPPRRSRYIDAAGVVFQYDGQRWNELMNHTFKAATYTTDPPALELRDMENDLPTLQKFVGGYLEADALAGGLLLVCNEDGVRLKLPAVWVVVFPGQIPRAIVGNFFVCRQVDGEFADLQDGDGEALAKIIRPNLGGGVA